MGDIPGKIKEVLGWLTGDRRVEAKGRVEQKAADPGAKVEDVSEEAVDEEQQDVRVEHGDIDPEAR